MRLSWKCILLAANYALLHTSSPEMAQSQNAATKKDSFMSALIILVIKFSNKTALAPRIMVAATGRKAIYFL